jgi:hypothetical protein
MYNNSEHHLGTLSWLSGRKDATKEKKMISRAHAQSITKTEKENLSARLLALLSITLLLSLLAQKEERKKKKQRQCKPLIRNLITSLQPPYIKWAKMAMRM